MDLTMSQNVFYDAVRQVVDQIVRLREDSPNYIVDVHDLR